MLTKLFVLHVMDSFSFVCHYVTQASVVSEVLKEFPVTYGLNFDRVFDEFKKNTNTLIKDEDKDVLLQAITNNISYDKSDNLMNQKLVVTPSKGNTTVSSLTDNNVYESGIGKKEDLTKDVEDYATSPLHGIGEGQDNIVGFDAFLNENYDDVVRTPNQTPHWHEKAASVETDFGEFT